MYRFTRPDVILNSAEIVVPVNKRLSEYILNDLLKFQDADECGLMKAHDLNSQSFIVSWRYDMQWYQAKIVMHETAFSLIVPIGKVSSECIESLRDALFSYLLQSVTDLIVTAGYIKIIDLKFSYNDSEMQIQKWGCQSAEEWANPVHSDSVDLNMRMKKFECIHSEREFVRNLWSPQSILHRYRVFESGRLVDNGNKTIIPIVFSELKKLTALMPSLSRTISPDYWQDEATTGVRKPDRVTPSSQVSVNH